jgi:hypothetical protein
MTAGTIKLRILDTQQRKRKRTDLVINDQNKFLDTRNAEGVAGIGDQEAAAKDAPERMIVQKQMTAMTAQDRSAVRPNIQKTTPHGRVQTLFRNDQRFVLISCLNSQPDSRNCFSMFKRIT